MQLGGEIVKSFYDYDTSKIGPFEIPIKFQPPEKEMSDGFSLYRYYEVLLKDDEAIACFNNANYSFTVIRRNYIYQVPYSKFHKPQKGDMFSSFFLDKPIQAPTFKHIGYVKTYPECKAVYHYPWYLLQDTSTGKAWGMKDEITGNPMENPPVTLYKALIDSPHKAVYFDLVSCAPVFID